nr:immunoglobulin light chain junction region [Macaca mulatta]
CLQYKTSPYMYTF